MRELRIAIAGLGTVGSSTLRLLQSQSEMLASRAGQRLRVTAVTARQANKLRDLRLEGIAWADTALALAERDDVDVVVELIGGSEGAARDLAEATLRKGKHLVTANKALLAHHGAKLALLAERGQAALRFEAAVAGAIPIIKMLREGLAANKIERMGGILNGTCNFILTAMEKTGHSFDVILEEAQQLGYAEADPSFDIDGIDTAHKLAVLAAIAYGAKVDFGKISVEGIRRITPRDIGYARSLGYGIKLLGLAHMGAHGLAMGVHPALVGMDQPMAKVSAEYNAVEIHSSAAGPMFVEGRGAGGDATASAVMADLVDIARGNHLYPYGLPAEALATPAILPMDERFGGYYLRLEVVDRPGVLAAITAEFYRNNISIKSCIQHSRRPSEPVDLVIITHPLYEKSLKTALANVSDMDFCIEEPLMIRMEELALRMEP